MQGLTTLTGILLLATFATTLLSLGGLAAWAGFRTRFTVSVLRGFHVFQLSFVVTQLAFAVFVVSEFLELLMGLGVVEHLLNLFVTILLLVGQLFLARIIFTKLKGD